MAMFSLAGKRAFITGGASGIGRAVAEAYVSQGAGVVIADIRDATAMAGRIGAGFVKTDVAEEKSVADALGNAVEMLGGLLDVVVLNAGVGDVGPTLEETPQELVEKVTRVNYWGVLYGLKHAPPNLNDGGSIISTSSMAATINLPGSAVYSAAKRAVVSMTEMSALELGKRNIRVNCVCPGYVVTTLGSGKEGKQISEAFTALGRAAEVGDIVGAYVFLAADESGYVTGQALRIDGGWSCGPTEALLERVTGSATAPG